MTEDLSAMDPAPILEKLERDIDALVGNLRKMDLDAGLVVAFDFEDYGRFYEAATTGAFVFVEEARALIIRHRNGLPVTRNLVAFARIAAAFTEGQNE